MIHHPGQARFVDRDTKTVTVTRPCRVTKEPFSVVVSTDAYARWAQGTLAQHAFPELSDDQREFLISDTTPAEWEELFSDWEEEETADETS